MHVTGNNNSTDVLTLVFLSVTEIPIE